METKIIEENKPQYEKEQDELLKAILQYRFFNPWKNIGECDDLRSLQHDSNLELFITGACNQKCEYCYLVKHPELYPKEISKPETILHNLELLYQYCIGNNFHFPKLDMFSGEIWHTQLGRDILELTLKYTKMGLSYDEILTTSNCCFINNREDMHRLQTYIDAFRELGFIFNISISVDGKIIDEQSRPRNSKEAYTDDFYEMLFTFAKANNYRFHPMVSAHNVHLWSENFKWWKEMCEKYEFDVHDVMMLEVRNDEWDEESIKTYCTFIIELMEDFLHTHCNDDITVLANFLGSTRFDTTPDISGYFPWCLPQSDTFTGCTICNQLTVRLGDLAICPCHRTAYSKYLYGYFVVENDEIVDIRAQNPQMAIKILMQNTHTGNIGCDCCLYNSVCLQGCFGAQLEANGDPFFPCKTVCQFFDSKYSTILQYLKDKGIIDYYETFSAQESNSGHVVEILKLYHQWEAIRKWPGNKQT